MVLFGVYPVGKDPGQHGAVIIAAVNGIVDGRVDRACCAVALEGAEGQVVVPGDHAEFAVFFMQVVIVHHAAGIAVAVADKVVHHKIAEHALHLQGVFQIGAAAQVFQRADEALLVGGGNIGFRIVKNIGIAFRVVIDVLELHIVASHPAGSCAALPGGLGHAGVLSGVIPGRQGPLPLTVRLRSLPSRRKVRLLCAVFPSGRKNARRILPGVTAVRGISGSVQVQTHVLHTEALAVAAPAAKACAVRLVKLAFVRAVVAPEEGVLHAFHGEIQAPVLAVDRDIDEAAQGRLHTEAAHHLIHQIILHHGIVLNQIVEAQLVQAIIAFPLFIPVKFQLEAVPLAAHGAYAAEGGIAFCPYPHIFIAFAVNDNGTGTVFLVFAGRDKRVPAVHHDVDPVDLIGGEQAAFVAHGLSESYKSKAGAVHKKQGKHQRGGNGGHADPVHMLAR